MRERLYISIPDLAECREVPRKYPIESDEALAVDFEPHRRYSELGDDDGSYLAASE